MGEYSRRHAAVLAELVEWWEDVSREGIGSRCVLVAVPPRWGRSTLLTRFAAVVGADELGGVVVPIPSALLPEGAGVQAGRMAGWLEEARRSPRVAELVGVDRLGGAVQQGLAVGGLLVSLPMAAVMLAAGVGVGVAGQLWDRSAAGREGALARAGRSVAALSVRVPVAVLIDDADQLDPQLAVTLIESLIERHDGWVVVVVAAAPGSRVIRELQARARYGLTEGRVQLAEADPDMGEQARADLAAELCPDLPTLAARRIGQRAQTFTEVFRVTSVPRLAELDDLDAAAAVAVVDDVFDDQPVTAEPPVEAVVLAWAGGILHVRQLEAALAVLDADPSPGGPAVRGGGLARLPGPVTAGLRQRVRVLLAETGLRRRMAAVVLRAAAAVAADPDSGLVDRVVAGQAAHRVRIDLPEQDRRPLIMVQCELVHGLEALGDLPAAYRVADEALASFPGEDTSPEREFLSAAVLRLASAGVAPPGDPVVEEAVAFALSGGAAVSLEARVWAAAELLRQPAHRETGVRLAGEVAAELDARTDLGPADDQWRLLLALHAARAAAPSLMQRLLAPLLTADTPKTWAAANAVLLAAGDPQADARLQIVILEAELLTAPPGLGEDRLRLHHALGDAYDRVGDFRQALRHGQQELPLRIFHQGRDHPDTLATRYSIANWTGQSGNPAAALRLAGELLSDQERVLGAEHPDTLVTRSDLAAWTGEAGDVAAARDQYTELLSLFKRVEGAEHPVTLAARANLALWTGQAGDSAAARDQYTALLPICERVEGAEHPATLAARANLALWTGEAGEAAAARNQYAALLPVVEQVLGAEHPHTLTTRGNLARWTGEAGDAAAARDQYATVLSAHERVLGAEHPATLTMRATLARWTGQAGDAAAARDQYATVLPLRERVSGPEHPDTLAVRANVALWTGEAGDAAAARDQYTELLPIFERVEGAEHPATLAARTNLARWTGEAGDAAAARDQYTELFPIFERVLGAEHPHTLAARANLAHWAERAN